MRDYCSGALTMARPKKAVMRQFAKASLEARGFKVEIRTSQGILPGARLVAVKDKKSYRVAVRTSYERSVSFNRHMDGRWRTLDSVDLIVVVVPQENNSNGVEVLAFDSTKLKKFFDKALQDLALADRSLSFEMPIFVPLDLTSRKNVGHSVAGIKNAALWSRCSEEGELLKTTTVAPKLLGNLYRSSKARVCRKKRGRREQGTGGISDYRLTPYRAKCRPAAFTADIFALTARRQ